MAELIVEVVEGAEAGRQLPLDAAIDIGREAGLPLQLEGDSQVSRRHARVVAQGRQAVVEDLGSTNGTFVNEQPIHGARTLNPGDRIRIGLTVLELRSAEQVRARPSAVIPRPELTAVGEQVLAPVPEQQLAPVGFKAQETPPAFVPAEVVGDPEAESDYRAIARLVDTRVKQQRNVAAFAMLTAAALAVIIYFGVT